MLVRPLRALVSLSDKSNLADLAKILIDHNIDVLSTGGTAKSLRDGGVKVKDVSLHTGFPEIMDGRVKTLHPKIHGGILARRDNEEHLSAMGEHAIEQIDLIIVNLYPFLDTIKKGASYDDAIENIDIGGPSMIRSAAKNHHFVTVITDPKLYILLAQELKNNEGATSLEFRQKMAANAFAHTAAYDAVISQWFAGQLNDKFPATLNLSASLKQTLRYGENPHQLAGFYSYGNNVGVGGALQLQGKELSYNNINDLDAALQLVNEFEQAACAIIKHANPCGVGIGDDLSISYDKALASDPLSAFGGIIAFNKIVDGALATKISMLFVEAIIAPHYTDEALAIFAKKNNLRLLRCDGAINSESEYHVKSVSGGLLLQNYDNLQVAKEDLKTVTIKEISDEQLIDLDFAFKVCKHVKSNAIVLVKNGATIGIGAGQMSRVDAVRIAAIKASDSKEDKNRAKGSVLASDAFFPFADGLLEAAKIGVVAVIQPGGSMRDEEVIKAADENNMAMLFTGHRHFKH